MAPEIVSPLNGALEMVRRFHASAFAPGRERAPAMQVNASGLAPQRAQHRRAPGTPQSPAQRQRRDDLSYKNPPFGMRRVGHP